jgi:poly-gamma-glutamate capsule biosynthesis protein CapA/YwtB (metallophosphatase superfamily)
MNELKLIAVGDMMLGRGVGEMISRNGSGFPFLNVKRVLEEGDILFGVLDSPVSLKKVPNPDKPKDFPKLFCAPEAISTLKDAGFDVIHIGTNHILDFGEEGLNSTIDLLDRKGIKHIGAGRDLEEARSPSTIERNGIRIGFLGYCLSYPVDNKRGGCAPLKIGLIEEDIKRLEHDVDHIVVSLHHGIEYSLYPYPEYIDIVHKIVEAGAHVVLGHHPHSLQGYEWYKDAYIIYSLANFVFDKDDKVTDINGVSKIRVSLENEGIIARPQSKKFYESIISNILFEKDKVKKIEHLPIVINDEFQPTLASGERNRDILDYFEAISSDLGKRELPFFKSLSKLYAEEDVGSFFKKDILSIVKQLHRIRPKHIKQLFRYVEARNVR